MPLIQYLGGRGRGAQKFKVILVYRSSLRHLKLLKKDPVSKTAK